MTTTTLPLLDRIVIWLVTASFFCNGMAAFLNSLTGDIGGVVWNLSKIAFTGIAAIIIFRYILPTMKETP